MSILGLLRHHSKPQFPSKIQTISTTKIVLRHLYKIKGNIATLDTTNIFLGKHIYITIFLKNANYHIGHLTHESRPTA